MARLDRPWRRPGAARYALRRLPGLLRPPVSVDEPAAGSLSVLRDLSVVVRDGTTLRVNVVLPAGGGRFPVLMSAHPYGKDALPRRRGRGYRVSFQYRLLRQPDPVRFSVLTGWEAPDPAWWVAQGYAVVNCDLRGAGTSEGSAGLLSDQEGEDVHDLIEWAASQPWSTGAVGMLGVSYLAISQWKAAALQPPGLKAICPWEGFTDAYRDLLRPGGIRENGFTRLWSLGLRRVRQRYRLTGQQQRHPLRDEWWRGLVPALEKITVPALICGSFSDNNLHSRGSVRRLGTHLQHRPVPLHPSRRQVGHLLLARSPRCTTAVLRPLPARPGCPGAATGAARSPRKPRRHHQRARRGQLAAGPDRMDAALPDRRRARHRATTSGWAHHLRPAFAGHML